jgi:myosin-5
MAHNYDIGTKAWQPDVTEGWVASEVTSKTADGDKVILIFTLANGEVRLFQSFSSKLWTSYSTENLTNSCFMMAD